MYGTLKELRRQRDDANRTIQLRSNDNTAIGGLIEIEPVAEGVPNLYTRRL